MTTIELEEQAEKERVLKLFVEVGKWVSFETGHEIELRHTNDPANLYDQNLIVVSGGWELLTLAEQKLLKERNEVCFSLVEKLDKRVHELED